ncbi:hypothetical protein Gpo141_00013509, partial [Globisporangium polare]
MINSTTGVAATLVNQTSSSAAGDSMAQAGQPGTHSLDDAAQSTRMMLSFFLFEYAGIWLICITLVALVRLNRAAAFKGDDVAARRIILPAFEPLLVVLGISNGLVVIFLSVTLATGFYDIFVPPVILEMLYSAHQFGFMLILVFMLQKSVSIPALRRATAISILLSGYTIPYIWWVTTYGNPVKQITYVQWLHVLRALVLLLSIYVFFWPPSRSSERALRELAIYDVVRYLMTTIHMVLVMNPATRANGKYALYALLSWNSLIPIVIWRVLKADTDYWRG